MDKIAHIHLEGPLIKAARALIPEKPISLGWNTQFPWDTQFPSQKACWAFVFKDLPSKRAIKAALLTGLDFHLTPGYSAIALTGVKEDEIELATKRFNLFAAEYKSVSKKTASIINRYINEDPPEVKTITVKSGRKRFESIVVSIRKLANTLY